MLPPSAQPCLQFLLLKKLEFTAHHCASGCRSRELRHQIYHDSLDSRTYDSLPCCSHHLMLAASRRLSHNRMIHLSLPEYPL